MSEPESILDTASEEARKLAVELLPKAAELAKEYIAGKGWPDETIVGALSELDLAIYRADKLDEKLAAEVKRRQEASDFAKSVMNKAIEIALRLAVAGLGGHGG